MIKAGKEISIKYGTGKEAKALVYSFNRYARGGKVKYGEMFFQGDAADDRDSRG